MKEESYFKCLHCGNFSLYVMTNGRKRIVVHSEGTMIPLEIFKRINKNILKTFFDE